MNISLDIKSQTHNFFMDMSWNNCQKREKEKKKKKKVKLIGELK